MKELISIQSKLKAPKDKRNEFGKYNYRSAEGILEAVKPLLTESKCTLTITDDILLLGDRFYVKATVTIKNSTGETETATAFAREEETKKGMDASQITGTASSYARKYALNGLLCIDDTKDADALNTSPEYTQPVSSAVPKSVFDSIRNAATRDELVSIYNKYPQYHNNAEFVTVITERSAVVTKKTS